MIPSIRLLDHNTKVKVKGKGKGKDFKVPFYFHRKNGNPIYLAGIYTNTADGRRTFAVLTKDATPMFAEIHNEKKRRPVIIDDGNLESWLHNGNKVSDVQDFMHDDLWEGNLEAYPVTKDLYSRTWIPIILTSQTKWTTKKSLFLLGDHKKEGPVSRPLRSFKLIPNGFGLLFQFRYPFLDPCLTFLALF